MSSIPSGATTESLAEEISTFKALILSLEADQENATQLKMDWERQIATLEQRKSMLTDHSALRATNHNSMAPLNPPDGSSLFQLNPQSSSSAAPYEQNSQPQISVPTISPPLDNGSSWNFNLLDPSYVPEANVADSQEGLVVSFGSNSSPISTPISGGSSSGKLLTLPTRKHGLDWNTSSEREPKSRRTTPSLPHTGRTTPLSWPDDMTHYDEVYARQLAAEQDEIDEEMIRFTQAQYEKELKAKVEQEKRYGNKLLSALRISTERLLESIKSSRADFSSDEMYARSISNPQISDLGQAQPRKFAQTSLNRTKLEKGVKPESMPGSDLADKTFGLDFLSDRNIKPEEGFARFARDVSFGAGNGTNGIETIDLSGDYDNLDYLSQGNNASNVNQFSEYGQTSSSSSTLGSFLYDNPPFTDMNPWSKYADSNFGFSTSTQTTSAFKGISEVYDMAGNTATDLGDPSVSSINGSDAANQSMNYPFADTGLRDDLNFMINPDTYRPSGPYLPRDMNARQSAYADYIYNDPTKTRKEVEELLSNIRPDVEIPEKDREGTPAEMKYPLMMHQRLGLTWMKGMERGTNKGGILADDMGLGKTIQALALMVSCPSDDERRKTTLIVAPVSLLRQWEREINTKLKAEAKLTVFVCHGNKTKTSWEHLRTYDVVLCTYGKLSSELKQKEQYEHRLLENPDLDQRSRPKLNIIGDNCKWYRVILDEAQCVKNPSTKASAAACLLEAKTRWCMTGTPMMNNLNELHALIKFLRIKPYNELKVFNLAFVKPLKMPSKSANERAMNKLHALLKAVLLRRMKSSRIDGKPIIELPPVVTEVKHAVFSPDEMDFYTALESQTQLQFNRYLKAGTVGKNYSNVLVLLLRLRQACCHPHLIRNHAEPLATLAEGADAIARMLKVAEGLEADVIARIRESAPDFECPVCYDVAENPRIFSPCGHDTCSECFAKITDSAGAQSIAEGNAEARRGGDIKCPSCRGTVKQDNVTDYASFAQVHMPVVSSQDPEAASIPTNSQDVEIEDETSDDTSDDLSDFVVPDDYESDESADDHKDSESDIKSLLNNQSMKYETSSMAEPRKESGRSRENRGRKSMRARKGKGKVEAPQQTLAVLKREASKNAKNKTKYLKRLREEFVSSAKTDKACEILQNIQESGANEKSIVFSQFTSLLDLLEIPISEKKWGYQRYDGSMTSQQRDDAVQEFISNPQCKIMLISLKAGNAGLNLVAASQVLILDPFWNPYVELQAVDRAHRIGQQSTVTVHRILVERTVEDRILDLQEKKRELIESALDEKASQKIARLGEKELTYLFFGREG